MPDTDPTNAPPPDRDRMQRLRVGLTGLAAVMIAVAVATAIASGVKSSGEGNVVVPEVAVVSNTVDPASEPLAQLGAAPGGTQEVMAENKPKPGR